MANKNTKLAGQPFSPELEATAGSEPCTEETFLIDRQKMRVSQNCRYLFGMFGGSILEYP